MQTIAIAHARTPASMATRVAAAAAAAGLGLILLGVAVPWITVFRGLQPIPGFVLEGGPLAGFAIASLGLLAVSASKGGSRWLKPLTFLIGLAVAVDATLLQFRIVDYVADPGLAGPLTQPAAGIGAGLMALGAALIVVAIVVLPARTSRLAAGSLRRLVMAAALFAAGWIHLMLVPEHLGESMILGLGFLASGIAQVILATLVLWRPKDWNLSLVIAINVTLIAIYAYAVMVGLPFGDHAQHEQAVGLVLGAGEPIDWYGAISKIAELVSTAIAFVLLGSKRLQNPFGSVE